MANSGRTKHYLLLTETDFAELADALRRIQPLDKSFLMFKAINTGLSRSEQKVKSTKRTHIVYFWLPSDVARRIKQLAKAQGLTQQSLMREFLFRYLASPPWKGLTRGDATESAARGEQESSKGDDFLTESEGAEYERLERELREALRRMGGYEPALDDMSIEQVAKSAIYLKRLEIFLDAEDATEFTWARVTDCMMKLSKTLDAAMHQLAVSRRDRLTGQTESALMNELREALLKTSEAEEAHKQQRYQPT